MINLNEKQVKELSGILDEVADVLMALGEIFGEREYTMMASLPVKMTVKEVMTSEGEFDEDLRELVLGMLENGLETFNMYGKIVNDDEVIKEDAPRDEIQKIRESVIVATASIEEYIELFSKPITVN